MIETILSIPDKQSFHVFMNSISGRYYHGCTQYSNNLGVKVITWKMTTLKAKVLYTYVRPALCAVAMMVGRLSAPVRSMLLERIPGLQ